MHSISELFKNSMKSLVSLHIFLQAFHILILYTICISRDRKANSNELNIATERIWKLLLFKNSALP